MSIVPGTALQGPAQAIPPAPAPGSTLPETLRSVTARPPTTAYAESWHDEPSIFLPEQLGDLETQLPAAIAQATAALSPSQPVEVIEALQALATRRGFDLPDGIALEMDVEVLASWPRDLFVKAFRIVWERFSYRRLPEVADFYEPIKLAMAERRERLAKLQSLKLRLETVKMRERLDREARQRHAARRERELKALRAAAEKAAAQMGSGAAADKESPQCLVQPNVETVRLADDEQSVLGKVGSAMEAGAPPTLDLEARQLRASRSATEDAVAGQASCSSPKQTLLPLERSSGYYGAKRVQHSIGFSESSFTSGERFVRPAQVLPFNFLLQRHRRGFFAVTIGDSNGSTMSAGACLHQQAARRRWPVPHDRATELLDDSGRFRFQGMAESIVGRHEVPALLALFDEGAGRSSGQGMVVPGPMKAVGTALPARQFRRPRTPDKENPLVIPCSRSTLYLPFP